MTDKPISENLVDHILSIKPGSKVEMRDGVECLVIPEYDFDTDQTAWIVRPIVKSATGPKFKPGDTLKHTETGESFDIVDPLAKILGADKVKKRDKPDDEPV
jgi:hypothetical protein